MTWLAFILMAVLLGRMIACCVEVWVLGQLRQAEHRMRELWDDGDDPDWVVEAREEIAKLPERVQ